MLAGADAAVRPLLNEAGGHRYQRVPPTERKGRVHTSTVTVAVFEVQAENQWTLRDADILTFAKKGSGPGGQHRNKTESCIVMRHLPTGIEATASEKSQHQNRRTARAELEARVAAKLQGDRETKVSQDRRAQRGSGQRGDKIRTYRLQDDIASDHRSGKKAPASRVSNGQLDLMF